MKRTNIHINPDSINRSKGWLDVLFTTNRRLDRNNISTDKICEVLDISINTARKYRRDDWLSASCRTVYNLLRHLETLE